MAYNPNFQRLQQQVRAAQQQAQRAAREIDAYNRRAAEHNRRVVNAVNDYNRRAAQHNRNLVNTLNAANGQVDAYNRNVDRRNRETLQALERARRPVHYSVSEQEMVDRVRAAQPAVSAPETDVFLSYAKIDGLDIATQLRDQLEALGVSSWFDPVSMRPGQSMSRQMDIGLSKARAGVVVLTPAYLAGRFWTERELGALLHKNTVIPVLHGVTFEDVAEYSGILTDLAGFTTSTDDVATIAEKIAGAVTPMAA